jgi:hypothetical protein
MTLVEVLVAMVMSLVIVSASTAMLISAVRDQPALSGKAQNVSTARWQLERIVRELRSSIKVETATASELSVVATMRRATCGGSVSTDPNAEPIKCKVTYRCTGTACTRNEATLGGTPVGTPTVALSGLDDPGNVFCFVPSTAADPTQCGPAQSESPPTYVGVNLEVPSPESPGLLTISDGATLRTATY